MPSPTRGAPRRCPVGTSLLGNAPDAIIRHMASPVDM